MKKYLYPIVIKKIRPYLKYRFLKGGKYVSAILQSLPLTLNNTLMGTIKNIKIYGNTVQDGVPSPENPVEIKNVEGKNILPNTLSSQIVSGVSIVKNNDGSLTLNGIARSQNSISIGTFSAKKGEKYTISGVTRFTDTTLQLFTSSSVAFPSGNRLQSFNGAKTVTALGDETVETKLFIYSGVTYSNVKVYPMVCENNTDDAYVPYNSIEFKVQNKNILDEKQLLNATNWTKNEEGYYTGTANALRTYFNNNTDIIDFMQNTQYAISLFGYYSTGSNIKLRIIYTDDTFEETSNFNNVSSKIEFISQANKTIKNITVNYSTAGNIFIKNFQIEKNSTITSYVAHAEQTSYFTFEEGQYLAEGGYLADDGIHNNLKKIVVNITSNSTLNLESGNKGIVLNISDKIYVLSNYLLCSKAVFDKTRSGIENTVYKNQRNVVFVGNSEDTAETLKAKYNGSILQYELANPQPTPYTPTQQAQWNAIKKMKTYNEQTNIDVLANLPCKISLDYLVKGGDN